MHKMIRSIPLAATVAWKHNNFQKEKTLLHFGATHVYMNVGLNVCYYFNVFVCVYIFVTQTLIGAAVVFVYVFFVVKCFCYFSV